MCRKTSVANQQSFTIDSLICDYREFLFTETKLP